MKLTGNRLVRPGEEDNAAISEVSINKDKPAYKGGQMGSNSMGVTLRKSCYKVNIKVVQFF